MQIQPWLVTCFYRCGLLPSSTTRAIWDSVVSVKASMSVRIHGYQKGLLEIFVRDVDQRNFGCKNANPQTLTINPQD